MYAVKCMILTIYKLYGKKNGLCSFYNFEKVYDPETTADIVYGVFIKEDTVWKSY